MSDALTVDETIEFLQALQDRTLDVFVERRAERDPESPTRIQAHVLNTLKKRGPTSVTEIAQMLQVTPPTASQLLNTLSDRGWVTTEMSQEDRRRHNVGITEAGLEILHEQHEQRLRRMRTVISQLTADERTMLVHLTDRVTTLWQEVRRHELSQEGSVPHRYQRNHPKDPH